MWNDSEQAFNSEFGHMAPMIAAGNPFGYLCKGVDDEKPEKRKKQIEYSWAHKPPEYTKFI
jgi:hypothetical protein